MCKIFKYYGAPVRYMCAPDRVKAFNGEFYHTPDTIATPPKYSSAATELHFAAHPYNKIFLQKYFYKIPSSNKV